LRRGEVACGNKEEIKLEAISSRTPEKKEGNIVNASNAELKSRENLRRIFVRYKTVPLAQEEGNRIRKLLL